MSKSKQKNIPLEFDFYPVQSVAKKRAPAGTASAKKGKVTDEPSKSEPAQPKLDQTKVVGNETDVSEIKATAPAFSDSEKVSPTKKEEPMNEIPTEKVAAGARRSLERQKRDHQVMNQILGGFGLAIIGGFLTVILLAAVGGYFLFKQIQDQSVTVEQLRLNTQTKLDRLASEMKESDKLMMESFSQMQAEYNLRLLQIQTLMDEKMAAQLDLIQKQGKQINDMQSTLSRVEKDLAKHKAALSQAQAKLAELDGLMDKDRRSNR